MTFKKLKTNFERELLFQIIQNLRKNKLTHDDAQNLAKEFLTLVNSGTSEEFMVKLSRLSETHAEILEAFIVTVGDYEKDHISECLKTARKNIDLLTINY